MIRIGPYQVLEQIGEGGMATVYRARRSEHGQDVVLKVMKQNALSLPDLHARFLREARIMSRLRHPHIIQFIDRGIHEGSPYIVSEFADQGDLSHHLSRQHLGLKDRLTLVLEVCCGLEYAHQIGIIHRDIKPGNILICSREGAKLSDFGIATALWSELTRLTKTQDTLGTLDYIAPEQRISPKQVDFRCDHYAIGVILYELITHHKPLGFFRPPRQLAPHVPKQLDQLVITCLDPEPQKRLSSTSALKETLREIISTLPRESQPPVTGELKGEILDSDHTLPGIDILLGEYESHSLQRKLSLRQQLISRLRQASTQLILEHLPNYSGMTKECLIESLLGRSDPAICPPMIELLNDPYYNEKAALVLAEQKCQQAEESLLKMLTGKSPYAHLAIRPLGLMKSEKAIGSIARFLGHEHSWLRALAMTALADINHPKCQKLIASQGQKDPDPENRAKAQHLLRRFDS